MKIRQGDVLLVKVDKLPKGLKEKDKILAYGEATGHKHQFISKAVTVHIDANGNQFVNAIAPAQLVHEEHANVDIPKGISFMWRSDLDLEFPEDYGIFAVRLQREFSPLDWACQEKNKPKPVLVQ